MKTAQQNKTMKLRLLSRIIRNIHGDASVFAHTRLMVDDQPVLVFAYWRVWYSTSTRSYLLAFTAQAAPHVLASVPKRGSTYEHGYVHKAIDAMERLNRERKSELKAAQIYAPTLK